MGSTFSDAVFKSVDIRVNFVENANRPSGANIPKGGFTVSNQTF